MENKNVSWDQWKCRCSSISKILTNTSESKPITEIQLKRLKELDEKPVRTEKQSIELTELIQKRENSKVVKLGDTCVAYLLEAFAWETEKMFSISKEMDVEYFERGRKTEPESIELLKEVDKKEYIKNEERFENDFLSGIPDVLEIGGRHMIEGPGNLEIFYAASIKDIKSCKDYPMFLYKIHKGLDPGNREQLQGYGDILECGDLGVAYTLPTMPQSIREGYRMKLAYKMNAAIDQDKEFERAWARLERSMIFDHMPASKRVYKLPVEPFTPFEKQAVYDRVKLCREWLNNFHESYLKLNQ